MSLEDLIPDDTGSGGVGRPKSRDLGETIEAAGKPFLPKHDDKEWWLDALEDTEDQAPVLEDKGLGEMEFHKTVEVIGVLSDYVSMHPTEVRLKLEKHEIHETDWEEYVDFFPDEVLDRRVPGYDGDDWSPTIKEDPWESNSNNSSSEEEEKEGGLFNLVEDARDK